MNWSEVELAVNKTKKFEVAAETIGCSPRSSSSGPRISPPPIPSSPAIKPLTKAYMGYVIMILVLHLTS
jgi:hypothetical protein